MKKTILLFFLFASTILLPAYCQDSTLEKDIYVKLEQYSLALNSKDAQKAASFYLSDSFFKYISDGFVVSREDWIKYKTESFNRMDIYSFHWTEKEILPLGKNSAIAHCQSTSSFRIKGGPMGTTKSIFTFVFEKIEGSWIIVSIHESGISVD